MLIWRIMRVHRFYVNTPVSGRKFDITDREMLHQWKSVFRYNVGSQVIIFDGSGTDYLCMITSLRNLGATLEIIEKLDGGGKAKRNLWLCLGIIKKDNFELVVEKATELGVSHIVPILCERSEKKNLNMERLKKITIEASEQSGRGDIPAIHDIVSLHDLLSSDVLPSSALVLDLDGSYVKDMITPEEPKTLAIFIGPEGGWSENELSMFLLANILKVSLGSQVLRAETAAISASSLLLL